jgi:recombination protein RecT
MADNRQLQTASPASNIAQVLTKMGPQLAAALPRHLTPERMIRVVLTEVRKNPKLAECDRNSFLGAVVQAAQLGLEPGLLGEAYLIPYGRECQLVPGYKGLLKLARQSGNIVSISARAVHEKDEFRYSYGLHEELHHVPTMDVDPGPITYVYAVARFKDGGHQMDVMSRAQIDAIRSQSKAGRSGPWVSHYDEMAKKTVLRRLCKMLPASTELARAVALDERADVGLSQDDGIEIINPETGEVLSAPAEERPPEGRRMSLGGRRPPTEEEEPIHVPTNEGVT